MNSIIHRARIICKKQLLTLVLACAMLISAAPLQAMALEEEQVEFPVTGNPADAQTPAGNWGFESGDLSGWTVLTPGWGVNEQGKSAGVVSAVSEGECEMPTNQSGSYHLSGLHNGIPAFDGWAVRSPGFVLSGSGWISVKMGGAAAAVKVFLADGTQVGYYRQSRYNNVNYPYLSQGGSWNDMATYAIDLSGYLGREMYLVLCDEVVGSEAYAVFDDVVTNYDAVPDAASRFDTVMDGHKVRAAASEVRIPWVIASNSYKPCTENNVQNGGFESGDLTGWTVLTEGFNASSAVVNERTYWAQELPYNQSGSYHLNGWNTGIPEEKGWALRSSTFVLGGSGFISVKMGGNAAVAKVFLADGTQVGYYRNFRFHDTNFPYISKGGAWCDMATYVIDLSDYLGKEMYIELHDEVITDGWANAFFDDVVTYYDSVPDWQNQRETVSNGFKDNVQCSPDTVDIPWQLAWNELDGSRPEVTMLLEEDAEVEPVEVEVPEESEMPEIPAESTESGESVEPVEPAESEKPLMPAEPIEPENPFDANPAEEAKGDSGGDSEEPKDEPKEAPKEAPKEVTEDELEEETNDEPEQEPIDNVQ